MESVCIGKLLVYVLHSGMLYNISCRILVRGMGPEGGGGGKGCCHRRPVAENFVSVDHIELKFRSDSFQAEWSRYMSATSTMTKGTISSD